MAHKVKYTHSAKEQSLNLDDGLKQQDCGKRFHACIQEYTVAKKLQFVPMGTIRLATWIVSV